MKIELSSQEFRTLTKMIALSTWITELLGESGVRRDFIHQKFEQILQKIYLQGVDAGMRDIELCDGGHENHLVLSQAPALFTEKILHDYTEHAFWGELEERLAERDFRKKEAPAPKKDSLTELQELAERYHKEFEKHGLEHLGILENKE